MSKNHRLATLVLLTAVLAALFWFPPTKPNTSTEITALLFSTLFLASFTALLLEHFFVRPTDVLAAGVSILLLLVPRPRAAEQVGTMVLGIVRVRSGFGRYGHACSVSIDQDRRGRKLEEPLGQRRLEMW